VSYFTIAIAAATPRLLRRPAAAVLIALAIAAAPRGAAADWPTLRGGARHWGYTEATVRPPFRLVWVRHFPGERLGTAMEPIVAGGRVFVATHAGSVTALDAASGEPQWRFRMHGPSLHSPAAMGGTVVAGSTDGRLYALDAATGRLRWSVFGGEGGFSAAPVIDAGMVTAPTRSGDVLAADLATGKLRWRARLGVPLRQTPAVAGGRVFLTSEEPRVYALDAATGRTLWRSELLAGQTARDACPMVVEAGGRTLVLVRTNPLQNMSLHIARDRAMLCRNAGVDDSDWRTIDAWVRSPESRGSPERWEREQQAILRYLEATREARTLFVLDAATGKEAFRAPVLWAAGCQGVGAMPARTADGRLLVFTRSAYGNWNLGVASLVALGLLNLQTNRIAPLEHAHGRQPPWNTFWGTADESQSFTVAGDTVLIAHQGTLAGFDLKQRTLFTVWGERDTYGGLPNLPWARNEWHGPGRGGVAVSENRIYWITGSRVLCLAQGAAGEPAKDRGIDAGSLRTVEAPPAPQTPAHRLREALSAGVEELLGRRWAPLVVEPGLAGRDLSFDHSGALFEALAWCWPHLEDSQRERARALLAAEWSAHAPWTPETWYDPARGAPREFGWRPADVRQRPPVDERHHPFGNTYSVWLTAVRCGEWPRVLGGWPQLKAAYEAFVRTGWRLDAEKGDLHANRYLASLLALEQIARRAGDAATATRAAAQAEETAAAVAAWWQRAATGGTLTTFRGSGELDPFIGKGDAISLRIAPHRHKLALFRDLTPEVARLVKARAPQAVARVWAIFESHYQTWWLTGEERQVHFGENFVDPPDLAMGGFAALAWLTDAPPERLARRVDLPFCRADLFHLTKLAVCLERAGSERAPVERRPPALR